MLEEIDAAVMEQGVTRTHFLRQAAERNLAHYRRVERPYYKLMQEKGLS
jgi:hypothetical protein